MSMKRRLSDDDDSDHVIRVKAMPPTYKVIPTRSAALMVDTSNMTVTWTDGIFERVFKNVAFTTDFGANLTVGSTTGEISVFSSIAKFEPLLQVQKWSPDIVGFLVTLSFQVWILRIDGGTRVQWDCGAQDLPGQYRCSTVGDTLYLWAMADADSVRCWTLDLAAGVMASCLSAPVHPGFEKIVIPLNDTLVVKSFGAMECAVLSTGDVIENDAQPFVGFDRVIYNNNGLVYGKSPISEAVPQWIFGTPNVNFMILTSSGTLTHYSANSDFAQS